MSCRLNAFACGAFVAIVIAAGGAASAADDDGYGATPADQRAARVATARGPTVTYIRSGISAPRSATVVTLVNGAPTTCDFRVDFFGQAAPSTVVCGLTATLGGRAGMDFCTRALPPSFTTCNRTCSPEPSIEGMAVIFTTDSAECRKVKVDARVYYASGTSSDTAIQAISNSRVQK